MYYSLCCVSSSFSLTLMALLSEKIHIIHINSLIKGLSSARSGLYVLGSGWGGGEREEIDSRENKDFVSFNVNYV